MELDDSSRCAVGVSAALHTELSLRCGFNSTHWSALFAKLSLKKLTIRGRPCCALETLQCFADGPITHSLEVLTLDTPSLPPSELPHLYQFCRLHTLYLDSCFSSCLDDLPIDTVFPPCLLLPALTSMRCHQWLSDGRLGHVERAGPSYEWMQKRQTQ